MKVLKNNQFKTIPGGSKGLYYEDGVSYVLNCSLVSQSCLDRFLICTEETLTEKEIYNCMKLVTIDYGFFEIKNAVDCIDDHLK